MGPTGKESDVIDRQSPTPYYEQLFVILRDRTAAGSPAPGERLPSENDLCREFGLSRATVRQTLQKLETEGWAQRIPRRGFFAASPEAASGWIVQDVAGFLESQLSHGTTGIDTRVVGAEFVAPPEFAATALGVSTDEQVFALERVRSLDDRLAMFSTNWFPGKVGKLIADEPAVLSGRGSVNSTLIRGGYHTSGAHRIIRAMRCPSAIADHLRVREGEPILRVRSLSWDHAGEKFDFYETWVLTDIVPLEVDVSVAPA